MDFGSAVKILSGKKSSEQSINETPATSKVITATVVSKSENGSVRVALDGQVFNEDDSQYIELDTVGGLEEGDTVNILLTGNSGYGLTPFAIGSVGSIDRLSERVTIAQEAGDIALATNQHFWTDTSGAHVTDDTSDAWNTEYAKDNHGQLSNPTDNDPWHNILLNSLGILLRRGLLNLTSISKSAIAFYDGTGNSSDNITASFGGNGAIIGKTSGRHVVVGVDGLSVYNSDGSLAPVNSTFDGKNIDGGSISGSKINFSTFEDGVISGSAIDTSTFKNGTISGSVIDTSTFENGTIEGSVIRASTLTDIPFAAIDQLETRVANIADAQIGTATIKQAQVENLSSDYAHIQNGIINNATIDAAKINNLQAKVGTFGYAHITNGVIDNAKIGYADVNELSANYAQINMSNVNNSWITNGTIARAAIKSEMVESISANKLTAGVINAYDISVTNLHASSLIVDKLNGQPVIGGYTYIPKTSSGYSSKNPKSLGWYEMTSSGFVKSNDTTVDMTKAYYLDGEATELYDRTYIDNLASELDDRIDGAIETFTTDTIPTLNNYPASDWLTDTVKDLHVGDICYVVNAGSEQDGYCYRFAYDNTSAQYKWVLIKDNQVTAALGRISNLETFESNTTSWIEETDEGLTTIRTNHTNLSGIVDKTVTETKQLWFTKANTTAPSRPSSAVTSTSTAGNAWRTVVPAWNASYPNYYYCLQYKLADGTYAWSDVVRDIAMGESQATSRDAQATADSNIKSSIQLWFTKANTTAPSKPSAEVTTNSASTVNAWNKAIPTYNSSYPNYFTCYQQQKGDGTYQWTDVVYDRSISEAQAKAQASLPSSTFETFKTTTFKEVVDEVDEQSSKITNLSTLTETLANPNLTQWFSAGVPQANGEYWQYVAGNGAPYIQLEDKGDGWMHAVLDNTSGTGTRRFDFDAVASDAIGLGKNYTFLFEFRNINSDNVSSQVYVVQESTYGMQFWGNFAQKLLQGTSTDCTVNLPNTLAQSGNQQAELCEDGIYRKRVVRKSEDSDSTYWTRSDIKRCLCMVIFCSAGGHFDAEFRFSIYDGEYLGPYKPYVPITEYTKTSNTVNDVKQTANENYAHITNLTTTLGTNSDGTSKSEDIVHKYNTLDQTLDETVSRVGATESHMETIANPNLTPYFSHPEEDTYNATTNPHGYWHVALNAASGNWTPLEDGWARLSYDNSSGTGTKYGNVRTEIVTSLKYDTDYTLMVEARNVTISGTVYLYGIAKRDGLGQFASSPTRQVLTTTDSAVYYQHAKTLSDYTGLKESTSGYIQITAGASITGDFRFSLYESAVKDGTVIPYSGPYKPYTDQNVSNYRVTQAESSITQNREEIALRVTKADYAKDVSIRLRMIREKWTDANWATYEAVGYTTSWVNKHVYSTGDTATGFDSTTLKIGDLVVVEGNSSDSSTPHALTAKVNAIPTSATGNINMTTIGANSSTGLTEKITNAETAIQQNSEAITLSAKKTEAVGNMLYDTDVNGLTAVNGPGPRYFSDAGQASTTVASFVALTDPPEPGIHYAAQFVCNGENTGANNRGLAFYQPENWTDLPMVVGQTYVVSYWARCTSGTGYVRVSRQEGSSVIYVPASKTVEGQTWTSVEDIGTEWRHIAVSFTHETKGAKYDRIWFRSYFVAGVAGTVQMCGFKLAPQAYATSAELKVANDEISTKVEKNGVISSINQSSESVTINANRVNIAGAAIFSSGGAFDTSATVVKSEMQWYSSTSASSATGGSWKASQPSVAAGHYIWQRELVTYANGTTAYKPSSAGVCIQGQTDLSDYSTTTAMNTAIGNAVDGIEIGGRNLARWTNTQVNGGTWNKALDPSESYGWYRYTSSTTIAKTTDGMKFTHNDSTARSGVVLYLGYPNAAIGLENLVISFDYRTNMTTLYNPYLLVAESGNPMQTSAMTCTASETEWVHGTWELKFPTSADKTVVAILFGYVNTNGGWLEIKKGTLKLEKGTKETGWSPAPEDVANDIESAISGQGGFTILWDYSAYTTQNLGEAYICALDPTTNETSDANGWVMWNSVKRTVPKGMVNPNSVHPFNIPLFIVLRLSSATATTGTNYVVHYNDGWKSGPMSGGSLSDWEWVEETDIVIGSFVMTGAETSVNSTIIFRTPWSSKQVTTATVTANSAYSLANTANNTANAAAPKSGAIARSQRIYYRQTSSGSAPGKNTTWLASSGTGYGNWSLSIPQLTTSSGTKYPKLYTAVQTQTVAQQAAGTTCTCSTVLLDDSITVIDGGSIITGSITANILKATVIAAVNGGDGKISADKINVSEISIGQSQVSGLSTALADKETAGAAAAVQSNLDTLTSGVTWMGICSTAAGTAAKVVVCAGFNADDLKTGATICVRFNAANTLADAITLNVNGTGAKTISVGQGASSDTNQLLWASGSTIRFYYNGTYWRVADTQPSYYGTCSTAAGTAAKTSSISGAVIYIGTTVNLNMTNANTNTSATLNVSSTGAKAIYYGTSTTRPTTANAYGWHAAETAAFVFDGQFWRYTNSMASYQAAQSAKTASNYIYASSDGIKIANSSPSTATTYQLQTATSTDFVVTGAVRNRINGDGMTLYDGTGVADSDIMAKFTSSLVELGKNSQDAVMKFCNGKLQLSYYNDTSRSIRYGDLYSEEMMALRSGYTESPASETGTRLGSVTTSLIEESSKVVSKIASYWYNVSSSNNRASISAVTSATNDDNYCYMDVNRGSNGAWLKLMLDSFFVGVDQSNSGPTLKLNSSGFAINGSTPIKAIYADTTVVTLNNGQWLQVADATTVTNKLGSGASQTNTICIAQNGDFNTYAGVVTGAMGQDGSARAYIYPNRTGIIRINYILIRFK